MTAPNPHQTPRRFIYCSSAGVYLKSDQMPHREEDATDLKSRHKVRSQAMAGGTRAGGTRVHGRRPPVPARMLQGY